MGFIGFVGFIGFKGFIGVLNLGLWFRVWEALIQDTDPGGFLI